MNIKNLKKSFLVIILLVVFLVPILSFADSNPLPSSGSGLVPCGTEDAQHNITNPCKFSDLLTLVNTVVRFVLIDLAVPIAGLAFAYAGFLLLTAGGETSKLTKAKKIFLNVALGLIIVAASWLIIEAILTLLGYDGAWIGF